MKIRKIAAWAGMIGPVLFTLSFLINGALRPGYNPVRQYVSELAIDTGGWIQILGFFVIGICLLLFSFGLKEVLAKGKMSRLAPTLFLIIGVCYILSGIFVTDPVSTIGSQQSITGILHSIFGAIVFSLSAAVGFVLWQRFRVDKEWQSLTTPVLVLSIVTVTLIILMKVAELLTGSILNDWVGVIQRSCLIVHYVLIFIVSLKMKSLGQKQ